MIVPFGRKRHWNHINIYTTWFLALNGPGRKPRKLFDCHNDTQPSFSLPISHHIVWKKGSLAFPASLLLFRVLEKTGKHLRCLISLVSAASFLRHSAWEGDVRAEAAPCQPRGWAVRTASQMGCPVPWMPQLWKHLHLDFSLCVIMKWLVISVNSTRL